MGTGAPPAIAMTSTVENFGKTVGMCRASSLRNCYLGGTNYVTDFVYRRKGLCVEVAILVFTLPGFNVQISLTKYNNILIALAFISIVCILYVSGCENCETIFTYSDGLSLD